MRQRPLLLAFLFLSVTSQAQVVINEVNIAGANEFIELYNKSSCAVDLGCYTLVFSSTSGGGNATGWTVKLPAGKSIAPCGYFLIGGVAGAAGVVGGTGYPNGGSMSSYPSADLDVGTTAITANAVYMKQGLSAGTLPNSEGQITLLSPAGTVVSSVSYNNGNNPGTYPLSAYATCNATGNTQGVNNISNPGASPVNINASFTAAGTQGIYLNASNVYVTTSVLTPKAANPSQLGCTPTITASSQAATICFSAAAQQTTLSYSSTTNSPTQYSIAWNPTPVNNFAPIVNAGLPASPITIVVPGGTMAGTYTGFLTVANANGHSCTPVPFTFTVNPAPVVDAGSYGPLCTNSSPHILTGIPAGGAFSGTGVGGNIFSPPGNGSYPVQYSFTDATTGCSNTATTTIVVNQQPIVTVTPSSATVCQNAAGVTLTAGGANSYAWSPSNGLSAVVGNSVIASPTSDIVYSVTGTDANGCTNTISASVFVAPIPATPQLSVVQPTCNTGTGSITVTTPTGTGFSYSIDGIDYSNSSGVFADLAPGTYNVTVKNSNGCLSGSTQATILAQPVAPVVLVNSPSICPGATATITATTSPAGSYNYLWTVPAGAGNPGNVASFPATVAGSYSVMVTAGNGCSHSATAVLSINALAVVTADSKQVCSGSTVNLTGQPVGGAWSGGNVTGSQFDATGLAPGDYPVSYTYTSGSCSGSATATITVHPIPAAPVVSVTNLCDGTSTLVATNSPGSLLWSTGAATSQISVTSAGTYIATQTVNGCVSIAATAIASPHTAPLSPVIGNVQQPNCLMATGSFVVSAPVGNGLAYSIDGTNYTNSTGAFSSLVAGSYLVTVRNSAGCISAITTVVINAPPSVPGAPVVQVIQPNCFWPTGSVTILSPLGADLTYSIVPGTFQSSTIFTGLAPGSYSITARNSSGCVSTSTQVVINPVLPLPLPILSVQQPTCLNAFGGISITSPSSGSGFTYSIDGIDYTNSAGVFVNLTPGNYNVSFQNNAGCISAPTAVVINPAPAGPSVAVNSAVICAGATATISATPSPGGNYTYAWTVPAGAANPGNVPSFPTIIPGAYSVTVTDNNGCTAFAFGTLTINAVAPVTAENKQVCIGSSVILTGQPAGGTWTGTGVSGAVFNATGLSAGDYTIIYSYTSGTCAGTATATVTVHPVPTAPVVSVSNACNGTSTLTAVNYTGVLLWGNGASTASITVSAAGNVAVTQTVNGCTSNTATALAAPQTTPFAPVIGNLEQPDCITSTGSFAVATPAGNGDVYSIDGINYSNTNGVFSGLLPGTYAITVKNAAGCVSPETTVAIAAAAGAPAAPVIQISQPGCTGNGGSIVIQSQPPIGNGSTYSIDGVNFQSSPSFLNLVPGTYSVLAKNNGGCVSAPAIAILLPSAGNVITNITRCINEGGSFSFNGQVLTTTGNYTTTYIRQGGCDSTVNLYLLVSKIEIQQLNGCGSFTYNGTTYLNSVTLRDTITSVVSACDSLYRVVQIEINPVSVNHLNVCLPAGQTYVFNGQLLTTSGQYSAVYASSKGCDSTINLSLVIADEEGQFISACKQVNYNGNVYTSYTVLTQTITSVLNGCDSVVQTIEIQILPSPVLLVPAARTICRGDVTTLKASAGSASIEWLGWGVTDSLVVSPVQTTPYQVVATNAAGCTDTAEIMVFVNDFDLQLSATPNPVFAGTKAQVHTKGSVPYKVLSWQPLAGNPFALSQSFVTDTTFKVKVIALGVNGCIDVDSLLIIADPMGDIYIPNAFTPNNDGKNDLFTVAGGHFLSFDLKIFNRWGQAVFTANERSKGWDGRAVGKEQPQGTYVYLLQAVLRDGKKVKRQGTFTLLR